MMSLIKRSSISFSILISVVKREHLAQSEVVGFFEDIASSKSIYYLMHKVNVIGLINKIKPGIARCIKGPFNPVIVILNLLRKSLTVSELPKIDR